MALEARLRLRLSLRACALCALGLALLTPACEKKTARTMPKVLVPSIESEPQQAPGAAAVPLVPPVPGPEFGPPPPPPEPAAEKNKHKHRKPAHKPVPPASAEAPKAEPSKAEKPASESAPASGGANPAQITAAVPPAAAQSQTQSTEQLLHSSEAKLAGLGRALSSSEKAMVQQARSYIDQSSEAMRAGDVERAYNLAMKANLLANELAK